MGIYISLLKFFSGNLCDCLWSASSIFFTMRKLSAFSDTFPVFYILK